MNYWDLPKEKRGWVYCKDEYLQVEWRYDYASEVVSFRCFNNHLLWHLFGGIFMVTNNEPTTLSQVFKNYLMLLEEYQKLLDLPLPGYGETCDEYD